MTRMVESIESLLSTGSWTTKRAKSPHHQRNSFTATPTIRANQSSKLDRTVPRYPINASNAVFYTRHFPPPPSVEDEKEALAKEVGGSIAGLSDEEPKSRGDVDQWPIILEVPEFNPNPERRFILVPADETDDQDQDRTKAPTLKDYTANTGRNLEPKEEKDGRPEIKRCRSRADLPRLATDNHIKENPAPQFQRTRSATCVSQKQRDYFSPHPESSRPAGDAFLSPVIKHATKGRDRAYWNFNAGANGAGAHNQVGDPRTGETRSGEPRSSEPRSSEPRSGDVGSGSSARRRVQEGYARSSHSSGPGANKRATSAMEVPREVRRTTERHSSYREESHARTRRNLPPTPPLDRKHSSPPRLTRKETSPTRPEPPKLSRRKSSYGNRPTPPREEDEFEYSSSRRDPPERHTLSRRKSNYNNRPSPPRERDDLDSSGDDCRDRKAQRPRYERRKSTVIQDDRKTLPSPDISRLPPFIGSKPRTTTPLASPKSSQQAFTPELDFLAAPRTSTTFSTTSNRLRTEIERPVSPVSSGGSTSSQSRSRYRPSERIVEIQQPRSHSRTPSLRSSTSSNKPVNVPTSLPPIPFPAPIYDPPSPNQRRGSQMPPSPLSSRQSSLETVPHPYPCWQPEPSYPSHHNLPTPRQSATDLDQPSLAITSYRRYYEDVSLGLRPGLPECPRRRPRAGLTDWFTLPRCDNLNICPSCYEQVFAPTEFRSQLVPAPTRVRDKEIACDLGTSPWLKIAWFMTRKYRHSDLRLLQGIAGVVTKNQPPCYGSMTVTRIWYSIKDPWSKRSIPDFRVCFPCAKAVETLFPNLTGVFTPMDTPAEATRGVCSLHFHPDRDRFAVYFDILESTYDRAMTTHSAPHIQRLADKIAAVASVNECARFNPIHDARWYTMRNIDDFTVCEDCFLQVVRPELEAEAEAASSGKGDGGTVALNFYQKAQLIRSGTACQLYSPRMQEVFRRACRRNDLEYLESKVQERLDILAGLGEKLDRLYCRCDEGRTPGYAEEKDRLMKEWKMWE